jgi:hypothetical protein
MSKATLTRQPKEEFVEDMRRGNTTCILSWQKPQFGVKKLAD